MSRWSRWFRWLCLAAFGLFALAIVAAVALYQATRHEPAFYRQALAQPEAQQQRASDELLAQASRVFSAANRPGDWEARFTAEQINGWLAVDVPQNHPGLLPPEIDSPRVAIEHDRISLGWRSRDPRFEGILSAEASVEMVEPNAFAIRIRRIRAGALPLPRNLALDAASKAARDSRAQLEWLQQDGDPVAILRLPEQVEQGQIRSIDTLRLEAGAIVVGGTTRPAKVAKRSGRE